MPPLLQKHNMFKNLQTPIQVIGLKQQVGQMRLIALVRQHHGFPRGEAVERSETDEERRNGLISYAVRNKVQSERLYVLI